MINCDSAPSNLISSTPDRRDRRFLSSVNFNIKTVFVKILAIVFLLAVNTMSEAAAETIPALPEISPATSVAYPRLVAYRTRLISDRSRLRKRTDQHNSSCRSVAEESPEFEQCDRSLDALSKDIDRHIEDSWRFIEQFTIDSIRIMASRLPDWDPKEHKRLELALGSLKEEVDAKATPADIRRAWTDVKSRGQPEALVRQAAQADGPNLYGAGEQTIHQDCTIFALAIAAGLPYGVVAARATSLIGDAEWRSAVEREAPQKTIEQVGLIGGEVIFLTEAFGQVEVVPRASFAKTLKEGRPVMVNLFPYSGNAYSGHQVVLAKAFQHRGELWYEMIDSNQGSVRRLYLNATELRVLQQERGIVYRSEDKATIKLFR